MKVKGVHKILKDLTGCLLIKFSKEVDYNTQPHSLLDSFLGPESTSGFYWKYTIDKKTHKGEWYRSYFQRIPKHFGAKESTPFEFLIITGTSLLSAIKYSKIAHNGYHASYEHFLSIRKNIRKLNPVPRKKRTTNERL